MKRYATCIVALSIAASVLPHPAEAQGVDDRLRALAADQPTERADAFYALLGGGTADIPAAVRNLFSRHPAERETISTALIRLLESESTRLTLDPPMMTERDGEFLGDLISAVASLRHPAAVSALLPVLRTGRTAMGGLADLGDAAVSGVVAQSKAASPGMRLDAVTTLGLVAERRAQNSLSALGMSTVRSNLLRSIEDKDPAVREAAVRSLMHFADDEIRTAVASLAASDPHKVTRGGRDAYTVREAAQEWLQRYRPR